MKTRFVPLLLALGISTGSSAESFTNIIDGFTTNITTEFIVGDSAPQNSLLITNGGAITNLDRVFIGNTVESHDNSAVVSGIGSVWHLEEAMYLGLRSPSNRMAILEGAKVRAAGVLAMGTYETASNNFLHVAGAGSALNAQWLHFGTYGSANELLFENAATAQIGGVIFNTEGRPNGGRQQAILRDSGTRMSITNLLQMGNSPANRLMVLSGAELVTQNAIIGTGRSSDNRVIVSGAGTEWWTVRDLTIGTILSASNSVLIADGSHARAAATRVSLGQTGTDNSYSIESGGVASLTQVTVGEQASAARNRLLVTGAGSALSNSAALTVGQSGSYNSFVVTDGALAWSRGDFGLGMQFTASNNVATVSGTNTLWIGNRLTVGSAGNFNTLRIDDGANVFAASVLSGGQGGSGNVSFVTGPGSLLSLTNALDIGAGNLLIVSNRAGLESGSGVIGSYQSGSAGLIDNASWSNAAGLTVGVHGSNNLLRILNNGRLYSSNATIGMGDHADNNFVEVSGKGSAGQVLNDLNVGSWGDTNELSVSRGASVSAKNFNVGGYFVPVPPAIYPGDANLASIRGTNTVMNVRSNITLGYEGSGNRIEVRSGARVTSSSIEVATRSNSKDNSILVTDPGTRWHNTNTLLLGSNGHRSSLTVSAGARLTTGSAMLGDGGFAVAVGGGKCTNRYGFNSVVVTGPGTLWEVGRQLIIGRNSTSNYVTVGDEATLRAHEIMAGFFGAACLPQEYENVFVLDGGNLVVSNRVFVGPRGRFRMLSGRAEVESFLVETGPGQRAEVFGGTLRADSIYASAPAEARIGDGTRRAVLELTGGHYFSSGRIIIASNSVLAGRGSISGGFTNSGTYGTLRAISALTNASLRGASGFDVWIAGVDAGSGHSMLHLSSQFQPAVIEGRLRVAISSSFQPEPTSEFPIVTYSTATNTFVNAPDSSRIKTVDNLGSFLVRYMPNAAILSDYRSTDLDGDLIEDAWATNYFGRSPLAPVERLSDRDGDGMSNYDEFRAGTDPTDPASALRVSATVAQGKATLRWACVDGKTYQIYFSSDMRTWREVIEPTFAFPEAGVCEWTGDGRAAQMQFYRVAVE